MIDHREGSGIIGDQIIGPVAAEHRGVIAGTAVEGVVAAAADQPVIAVIAVQHIGDRVADQRVVARPADGIVDIGPDIVVVQIGVVDIARCIVAVAEIGQLRGRGARRRAGVEIDRHPGGEVGHVVGIDAVAVPDRFEDAVGRTAGAAARRRLSHAVDELRSAGRAPSVDGVFAMGRIVRAVERLQREDIVGHIGLRKAIGFVGVSRERAADIAAVAHDGEFGIVMRGRHRDIGDAAGLLAVFEAEGVPEFVQRGREIVVAESCQRVVVRGSEPDIAASRNVRRIIGVGGRVSGRGLGHHDVGAIRPCVLDRGVGIALNQANRVDDGLLHLAGRRREACGRRFAIAVIA